MTWTLSQNAGGGRERETELDERRPLITHLEHEILHPFLGYVSNPDETVLRRRGRPDHRRDVSPLGFEVFGDEPSRGGDGEVRVAVLGGSMALMFVAHGGDVLARGLERAPAFKGSRVVIENWAGAGYKQPQQLSTLAYLLALGRTWDAVINLDGYNDIVLGFANFNDGVFPFFPRAWRWRVAETLDVETQRAIGKVAFLKERRATLAGSFAKTWLNRSATIGLVWRQLDRLTAGRVAEAEMELRGVPTREGGRDFEAFGPPLGLDTEKEYLDASVSLWRRSSEQMHALCVGAGIPYFHFLQPNQYVAGSKPILAQEKAVAYRPNSEGARLVESGYPLLAAAGEELQRHGVRFHDLRMVFADFEESLYLDHCCHVNRKGSEIMAAQVSELISASLAPEIEELNAGALGGVPEAESGSPPL